MKAAKIIIHIVVLLVGFGLIVLGQNGALLTPFGIDPHSAWNLLLEFIGLAFLLVELYIYNKKYTKYDVKPAKKAKK